MANSSMDRTQKVVSSEYSIVSKSCWQSLLKPDNILLVGAYLPSSMIDESILLNWDEDNCSSSSPNKGKISVPTLSIHDENY